MKRRDVIKKFHREAKARALQFSTRELAQHTEIRIWSTSKTLGRHAEVDDLTARRFFWTSSQMN